MPVESCGSFRINLVLAQKNICCGIFIYFSTGIKNNLSTYTIMDKLFLLEKEFV